MTVYFIGAGPGDPELITVKGQRLIRSCPLIIYAGQCKGCFGRMLACDQQAGRCASVSNDR